MDDSYDAASTANSSEYEETTHTTSECLPTALAGHSYDSSRDILHSADHSINPDVSLSPEQLWRGAGASGAPTVSTLSNNNTNGGASGEPAYAVVEEEVSSTQKSPETAMLYQSARRGTDAPSRIEPSPCIQPVKGEEHRAETSYESVADEEYDVDEEEEEYADEEDEDVEDVPFKAAISEGASSSSILQSASVAMAASNSKPHMAVVDGTPLGMAPFASSCTVAAASGGSPFEYNEVGTTVVLLTDTSASQVSIGGKNDRSVSLDSNSAAPAQQQKEAVAKKEDETPLTHKTTTTTVTQTPKLNASDSNESSSSSPFTPVTPPPPPGAFPTQEDVAHPTHKEDSSSISSSSHAPINTKIELSAIAPPTTTESQQRKEDAVGAEVSHTLSSPTSSYEEDNKAAQQEDEENTLKQSHQETAAATESKPTTARGNNDMKSSDTSSHVEDDSMPVVPAVVEGVSVIAVVPDEVSPSSSSSVSSLSYKSKSNVSYSHHSNDHPPSTRSSSINDVGPSAPPPFLYMTEEERRSHQVLMQYVILAEDKMNKDWRTRSLDDCRSTLAKMIPNRQQALANLEKR